MLATPGERQLFDNCLFAACDKSRAPDQQYTFAQMLDLHWRIIDRSNEKLASKHGRENVDLRRSSHPLEHRSQSLSATDAHGLEPVTTFTTAEFTQQRGEDTSTSGPHWVSERDTRSVRIQPGIVGFDTP